MSIQSARATFEFQLNQSKANALTPPFATGDNLFWQLEYCETYPNEPECFVVRLHVIPNEDELESILPWARRHELCATIYVINVHSEGNQQYVGKLALEMDKLTPDMKYRGFFYKKAKLAHNFLIGVTFSEFQTEARLVEGPFPNRKVPQDLIDAWLGEVNKQETVDVQFNVGGHIVYASSGVLGKRSEYFRNFFLRKWAESDEGMSSPSTANIRTRSKKKLSPIKDTVSEPSENGSSIKYTVNIPDFEYDTFLAMLRFLYTDNPNFSDEDGSPTSPLALMAISDKYLVVELRERAKEKLLKILNEDNAARILFDAAWKWPDVKEIVIDYVVRNFAKVRETPSFLNIDEAHPMAAKLLMQILKKVHVAQQRLTKF
ncbi:hypothetical protein G9A89_008926 [Geosiphon pyriformis]|nr:hypothetical protein G9A89_008926 [Geosiphon pyriformis]